MTGAVICYRKILEAMEELETRSLSLSPLAKLAANCPRCFGPAGTYGIQKGPQYIVCVDGNFQQRRHESASQEIEEIPLSIPSIFMRPEDVARWEPKDGQNDVLLDPCTAQHTAAADRRNASSWKGCKETGLIASVCRHNHMLKMVNVIHSGEKAHFVHALLGELFTCILEARTNTIKAGVGCLYDIGCTLEKGVIKSASHKLMTAENRLLEAQTQLQQLQATDNRLTVNYLLAQWERQRACQAEIMGDGTLQKLQTQLARLIELEEDFRDAHDDLNKLRQKRRRNMTPEEHEALQKLPDTLVALEEAIADLADDLGSDKFCNMPEVKDPRARLLMRVRLAKEKLYEAKVGKIQWQKKWDQPGIGTTDKARYKEVMNKRNKVLAQKYSTYKTTVKNYHHEYPNAPAQQLPTPEEVKYLEVSDIFGNIGHLTHPDKPWAVDVLTQTGIQAFWMARSCEEEIKRIACENEVGSTDG
ncbi:hypothetical protein DFH28DRAFT_1200891 [Melampsora americana]|nr:hypothetical protein DFH28DRAFT_1200891 [Melampsora americana]